MTPKTITYVLYLLIAVPLTIYVAQTLARHGREFLHDVFPERPSLADAVNRLLVVGFYLLNLGYVALFMQTDTSIDGAEAVLEELATRIGVVAIVIGVLHLGNVWLFNTLRRRATAQRQLVPPVAPSGHTTVQR